MVQSWPCTEVTQVHQFQDYYMFASSTSFREPY